jgi:hypothetical protein
MTRFMDQLERRCERLLAVVDGLAARIDALAAEHRWFRRMIRGL